MAATMFQLEVLHSTLGGPFTSAEILTHVLDYRANTGKFNFFGRLFGPNLRSVEKMLQRCESQGYVQRTQQTDGQAQAPTFKLTRLGELKAEPLSKFGSGYRAGPEKPFDGGRE